MAERFTVSPDVVAQQLGDEVILVHLKTDRTFVLNRTGARLWELLSAGHDLAEIQWRMTQEFDVGERQLAAETDALLDALRGEHLVGPPDVT
jgi:hypothetical protein